MLPVFTFKWDIIFHILCFVYLFLSVTKYHQLNMDSFYFAGPLLLSWLYWWNEGFISECWNLLWHEVMASRIFTAGGGGWHQHVRRKHLNMTFDKTVCLIFSVEVSWGLKSRCTWSSPWVTTLKETTPSINRNAWERSEVLMENPVSPFMTRNPEQKPSSKAAAGYVLLKWVLPSPGLRYEQKFAAMVLPQCL